MLDFCCGHLLSSICNTTFDLVSHDLSIYKFEYYHVSGIALALGQSYSTDRQQQYVAVNNDAPESEESVVRDLSQGSVLDALLFLIMINDLGVNVPAVIILFVNDTKVSYIGESVSQSCFEFNQHQNNNRIENWLPAIELVFSVERIFMLLQF